MQEIVEFTLSLVVTTAAIFALILWDEKRLDPERRERAWPPASRASAIVVFSILCIPVHFWRTRRSLWGVLLGFFWAFVVAEVSDVVVSLIEMVFFPE
jgi:hypothetical protein